MKTIPLVNKGITVKKATGHMKVRGMRTVSGIKKHENIKKLSGTGK